MSLNANFFLWNSKSKVFIGLDNMKRILIFEVATCSKRILLKNWAVQVTRSNSSSTDWTQKQNLLDEVGQVFFQLPDVLFDVWVLFAAVVVDDEEHVGDEVDDHLHRAAQLGELGVPDCRKP